MIRFFLLRIIQVIALIYYMWIVAVVLYDWGGWILAILGTIFTPVLAPVMLIAMGFIPSDAAPPMALWLPAGVIALSEHWIKKLRGC